VKSVCESELYGYVLKLLISTAGGRFPRAWLSLRVLRTLGSQGSCYSRRSRRFPFQSTV